MPRSKMKSVNVIHALRKPGLGTAKKILEKGDVDVAREHTVDANAGSGPSV